MPIRKSTIKNAKMKRTGERTVEWSVESKKFTGRQTGERTFEWDIKTNKSLVSKVKSKIGSAKRSYIKKHNEKVRDVLDILKKSGVPLNVLDRKDVMNAIHLRVEIYGPELMDKNIVKTLASETKKALKRNKLI